MAKTNIYSKVNFTTLKKELGSIMQYLQSEPVADEEIKRQGGYPPERKPKGVKIEWGFKGRCLYKPPINYKKVFKLKQGYK